MSDSAHLNGRVQPTPPAAAASADRVVSPDGQPGDEFDAAASLLRLLLGGVVVGADELQGRMRAWDAASRASAQTTPTMKAPDALRYTLIGALFDSEARVRRGFSKMRARLRRLSDEAEDEAEAYYASHDTPGMPSTPLDPLLLRLDGLLSNASSAIDRWTAQGWSEEQHGRRMARQATASVIDELFDYMAQNPEVRELVEQQATGMAGAAMNEVRGRTATADLWIERLAHNLLRRPASDMPAEPAGSPAAPALASGAQTPTPRVAPATTPLAAASAETPAPRGRHGATAPQQPHAPSAETPAPQNESGG